MASVRVAPRVRAGLVTDLAVLKHNLAFRGVGMMERGANADACPLAWQYRAPARTCIALSGTANQSGQVAWVGT